MVFIDEIVLVFLSLALSRITIIVLLRLIYSYFFSENFFGMEKEIENLITENNELMATKNALNIVKDDLIVKVDELQSDLAMCKNEIQQREAVQDRLKSRISQLEEELKKNKEELDDCKQKLAALKEVRFIFFILY